MLCEHYLIHGISLPVVANPHLTNLLLRDLNYGLGPKPEDGSQK